MRPQTIALVWLSLGLALGTVLGVTFSATARRVVQIVKAEFAAPDRRTLLKRSPPPGSIAIIGDSHIEAGPWEKLIGPDFSNYGIGGDTTIGVINRLDEIGGKRAVLLIGVNDILRGELAPEVATNIAIIVERLQRPVLLISLIPVKGTLAKHNSTLKQLNALIRMNCNPQNCAFLDIWPAMEVNGTLNPEFAEDDVHLNIEGYRIVAKLITAAFGDGTAR